MFVHKRLEFHDQLIPSFSIFNLKAHLNPNMTNFFAYFTRFSSFQYKFDDNPSKMRISPQKPLGKQI